MPKSPPYSHPDTLRHKCPKCGAKPGKPCITPSGAYATVSHRLRIEKRAQQLRRVKEVSPVAQQERLLVLLRHGFEKMMAERYPAVSLLRYARSGAYVSPRTKNMWNGWCLVYGVVPKIDKPTKS